MVNSLLINLHISSLLHFADDCFVELMQHQGTLGAQHKHSGDLKP